ncbi:MAG: NUDIX hydrolase [Cellulomonadaceae bacterium]|jgi:ADP-ribose pyrophosphatase|nr:NUDIX hydrolase [Cellulomonadaceae bacterium]
MSISDNTTDSAADVATDNASVPAEANSALTDRFAPCPVVEHREIWKGRIFSVYDDDVDLGDAGIVDRECISHPGAVAIVALDDQNRIALIDQYRHPVRSVLWEIPAGLLDVDGEAAHIGAARELAEEADLHAARWDVLVDLLTSPGCTNETLRVFLARDLSPVPEDQRYTRTEEEAGMHLTWMDLDDAVAAVLAGDLHSPSTVNGVLATYTARALNWSTLRPADSPMPYRRGNY